MAETFIIGLIIGFFFGLFVYWGFLINIHLHVSSVVMAEIIFRRIATSASRKGTIYYNNIEKLIEDSMFGFITFQGNDNTFRFNNPKLLCQEMMERQIKTFGSFFTTLLMLIGVKSANVTGKK